MSTTTSVHREPVHRPRRLGRRTRKGCLVLQIASADAWIGIDVVMGVLVLTAVLSVDVEPAALPVFKPSGRTS